MREPTYIPVTTTGEIAIPPPETQRGLDAVADLGMDPTGASCGAAILREYLDSADRACGELHFPPGFYYFSETVETNAKNVRLSGDGALANMGDAPVVFYTDQALDSILWWNGAQTNSNMQGPQIEGIQFQDRSPDNNRLRAAIRLTATANAELRVGFLNLRPQRYMEGTVSVETGSKTVAGSGARWDAAMAPGWIVIEGYPYEIVEAGAEALTLAIAYQGASLSGAEYAVNWGGTGVWLEPGTDFTQYGKDWSIDGRCGCALFASAGATSPKYTGTSRIKVRSGYVNGEGIPDSIACYLGPYSDTFLWDVAMNSYAFGVVVANGHQHDLMHGDYENAGGPPPVTGLPVDYASCHGILVMSDNASDAWGNRLGGYFRQVGTGIELYGQPGKAPTWTVIGVSTFRSNKWNFINGNATNTGGMIPAATYEYDDPEN